MSGLRSNVDAHKMRSQLNASIIYAMKTIQELLEEYFSSLRFQI